MEDDIHEAVRFFMNTAGQTTGKFNARQACLYTGLQLEELGEKIEAIMEGTVTAAARSDLALLAGVLKDYAKAFRNGMHEGDILRANHADLIDADFDLAWVSIGSAESTSIDAKAAFAHGTGTNLSKFHVDEHGKVQCIKDENGKVRKPEGWKAPDFTPFIDTFIRN